MPLYEFKCRDCEKEFEFLVRGRDWKREVACPSCGARGGARFEKLLSVAGAVGSRQSGAGEGCTGNPASCNRCCGME